MLHVSFSELRTYKGDVQSADETPHRHEKYLEIAGGRRPLLNLTAQAGANRLIWQRTIARAERLFDDH